MAFDGRRIRPLLTLAFFVAGGMLGHAMAYQYITMLEGYLLSGSKGAAPKLLWLIPINPTKLSDTEKTLLYTVFIVVGALLGFVVERIIFFQLKRVRARFESMSPQDKLAVVIGFILGLILTALLQSILKTPLFANVIAAVVLCYVSVVALESLKEQVRFYFPDSHHVARAEYGSYRPKLLDTNVIIDGRIADVCRAGFIEGPIFVPKFVLDELQQIADSSDSLKRARGRRGLEILNQMRKENELEVPDFVTDNSMMEVDARLVLAAREVGGAIITNDYNLNKVAELQGVEVLNINELANALKPVVLPGEEMRVTIIKEGKEKEQGIAYLDDGTMVVVEGARRFIGETFDISVTSVLQTVQGKMIFGKIRDSEEDNGTVEQSVSSDTGSRVRRKVR